jgi:hypothetical protein
MRTVNIMFSYLKKKKVSTLKYPLSITIKDRLLVSAIKSTGFADKNGIIYNYT